MKNGFLEVFYSGLESMAEELKRNDLLDWIYEIKMMTDDGLKDKHFTNPTEEIDKIWKALRDPSLTVCNGSSCGGSWHLVNWLS